MATFGSTHAGRFGSVLASLSLVVAASLASASAARTGSPAATATASPAASATPVAAAVPFDRAKWLSDYDALRAMLQRSYANLAWYGSPLGGVDLPALHRKTLDALAKATDDASAQAALVAFVKGFGDGHLSLKPSVAAVKPPDAIPTPPPPPIGTAPSVACEALEFTRDEPTRFTSLYEAMPGFTLISDGVAEAFRAGTVRAPNGTLLGIVRVGDFDPYEFPGECMEAWSKLQKDAGAPSVCDDACSGEMEQSVQTLLLQHLHDRLVALDRAGAQAVVVDLAKVPGGDDLGDWIPRLFTSAEVDSARLGVVGSPDSKKYYDEQLTNLRSEQTEHLDAADRRAVRAAIALYEDHERTLDGPACPMDWVWRERRPWNPFGTGASCSNLVFGGTYASGTMRWAPPNSIANSDAAASLFWPSVAWPFFGSWTKPVYVVIDGTTYSAAEMAAAIFSDNHIATLFGEKTGGDGCGFMYEMGFKLPASGMHVRIPNCVRLRSDDTDEKAGISPQIFVPSYAGENSAQHAERLIDAMSAYYAQHAAAAFPASAASAPPLGK